MESVDMHRDMEAELQRELLFLLRKRLLLLLQDRSCQYKDRSLFRMVSDMKFEADRLLFNRTFDCLTKPWLRNDSAQYVELTKDILSVFEISAKDTEIHEWTSTVLHRTRPLMGVIRFISLRPSSEYILDFGKALINLCCKVKSGELSKEILFGEEGIRLMVVQLPKKERNKSGFLRT